MTTVPIQLGRAIVLVKGVPSDICDACGKFFVDTTTSHQLMKIAQEAADRGDGAQIDRVAAAGGQQDRDGVVVAGVAVEQDGVGAGHGGAA